MRRQKIEVRSSGTFYVRNFWLKTAPAGHLLKIAKYCSGSEICIKTTTSSPHNPKQGGRWGSPPRGGGGGGKTRGRCSKGRERARPPKPRETRRRPEESEDAAHRERRGGLAATAEGGYRPRYRWTGRQSKLKGTRDRGRAGGGRARPLAWQGGVGIPPRWCKRLLDTSLRSVCAKIAPAYYFTRGAAAAPP